ncbi:Chlorophyllase enzyme [Phyllobacterium sp. YR620]|uniref:alpha/beta hydrolase family protein n=1 Tax=Phyllobacterium sp. YR620 TaxID=1881066 RepID=UPI00089105ED|nr:hypothetical protein [Phyllobacterium sp. YR620]SDP30339.1 Chlorophyllase enzyme [Phyllobacterium sp. YR620]
MTRWFIAEARRACLFGVLLAALAGCDGGGDDAAPPTTTFESPATEISSLPQAEAASLPQEPAIGTVTAVPGSEAEPPQTSGGEAIPIVPEAPQIVLPKPIVRSVTRFTEIAPDATGGATFWSSPAYEYNLGNLVAIASADSATFDDGSTLIQPMHGWMRYPTDAVGPTAPKTYPIIVLLHGNHDAAAPSYKGYDYLAEHLATHGYVVLSIDANAINGFAPGTTLRADPSSQTRAQLVLGTLDRLRQINEQGQLGPDGRPGSLHILKGKLDFSRIGIMGHSRGGQGIANTILFNANRRGTTQQDLIAAVASSGSKFSADYPDLTAAIKKTAVDEAKLAAAIKKYNIFYAVGSGNANVPPPYDFKAAFMLAPTDFGGNPGINRVPLAVLLPSCDGDMSNLQGAISYDHNRFGPDDDLASRYQIMVHGANHNDYNSIWTEDDFGPGGGPKFCFRTKGQTDSIRLSDEDQRRTGLFLINSFMRYHVGGESKFGAYWNSTARIPDAACPGGLGPCEERIIMTVQKDAGRRKLIQRFGAANSLEQTLLGGAISFTDFDDKARCNMPLGASTPGECMPKRLGGFEFTEGGSSGLRSIAEHVELAWSKPGAAITTDLTGLSGKDYDALTFRIAVVRPMGQEVLVTLTDSTGKAATLTASDFTNALYNAPRKKPDSLPPTDTGTSSTSPMAVPQTIPLLDDPADKPYSEGKVKILMNMVAFPLAAFEGVDPTKLKELKLVFPKESGKVAITDIELQNFGRDKPASDLAMQ